MSPDTIWIIIVAILLFNYGLERFLSYLNKSNMSTELPEELKGIYEPDKYKKSQEYDKANSSFGLITSTFSILLMLAMLYFDGFAMLDGFIRGYTTHPILMAMMFFGLLMVASDILGMPFSIYSTFVIEERFGFNRTTPKTFVLDKLKGYLIGGLIGGGLLALFIWFYESTGSLFWVYAWIAFSGFMLLMTSFYASVIVPIFNKLTPLENGELRTAIEEYCVKVDFKLDNLFVMDG